MNRVELHGSLGEGKYAIVDDEDFEMLQKLNWIVGNHGRPYAVLWRKKIDGVWKQKNILMHRYILSLDPSQQVDHINCNFLDNRKSNMRLATHQQNQFNRPPRGRTGRKGVTWHKGAQKYMVQIQKGYKYEYLGLFVNIDEASKVYQEAAERLFGEFAYDASREV